MDRFVVLLNLALGIVLTLHLAGAFGVTSPPPLPPTPAPSSAPAPTPAPPPAEFELTSLHIEPEETAVDETVNITVVVENIGGSEGIYTAILTVDGGPVDAKEVSITAGSSEVITFSLVEDTPDTYEIGIGGLKSTLTVKEKSELVVEKEDKLPPSTLDKAKDESEKPPSKTAAIKITFDREVVFCENGEWRWRVIMAEVNGVGVELNDITMASHGEHGVLWSWSDRSWLEAINNHLSPYRMAMSNRFVPCEPLSTHVIFTVTGVDDNGHTITASGRVDLSLAETAEKGLTANEEIELKVDAHSSHFSSGYYVQLMVDDPSQTIRSVDVTGPGIIGSISLVSGIAPNQWWSQPHVNLETSPPALPLVYTFTITDDAGNRDVFKDEVLSYVNNFATNLTPSGDQTVTDKPVFTWTGINMLDVRYTVQLNDEQGNRIWSSPPTTAISLVYDGPILVPGNYQYYVSAISQYGDESLASETFKVVP